MSVSRRAVLVVLADTTDAENRETTTVDALAATLGVSADAVETHVDALVDCELARWADGDRVRVTITGDELLALDTDNAIVVEPRPGEIDG